MAVGYAASGAAYSSDGISWTAASSGPGTEMSYAIAASKTAVIASRAASGSLYRSTDGDTWSSVGPSTSLSDSASQQWLVYADGVFRFAAHRSSDYKIYIVGSDDDGQNWTFGSAIDISGTYGYPRIGYDRKTDKWSHLFSTGTYKCLT